MIIKGEVVHRIFNTAKEAKSGVMYSYNYLVLKANRRETKAKKIMYDFYPIRIYSSNTTTPWLGDVQNGDIIECEVKVECSKYEDYEIEERSNTYNDYTEIAPKLWPNLSLDVFSGTAITVIESHGKEDKLEHNSGIANELPSPPGVDDLPFVWFIPIAGMMFLDSLVSIF